MMRTLLMLCVISALAGCSGFDLPSTRESQNAIEQLAPRIEMMDKIIAELPRPRQLFSDLDIRINTVALNRILLAVAGNRSDDVRIHFPPTPRIIEEHKIALGIPYTNYVDVDSGDVKLNLKSFRILSADHNRLNTVLHMEGEGRIAVTGKYTAVSASASPQVRFSLFDTVQFVLNGDELNTPRLYPVPDMIPLKITIGIKLLGFDIPYTYTAWLKVRDIIQPIPLPMQISSNIKMPAPSSTPGNRLTYIPVGITIGDARTRIENDRLGTSFNMEFLPDSTR